MARREILRARSRHVDRMISAASCCCGDALRLLRQLGEQSPRRRARISTPAAASRLKLPLRRNGRASSKPSPPLPAGRRLPTIYLRLTDRTRCALPAPSLPCAHSLTHSLLHDRLARPLAQVGDDALLAQRLARHASVAPVQNKPMVGVQLVIRRHHRFQFLLDLERVLAGAPCRCGCRRGKYACRPRWSARRRRR